MRSLHLLVGLPFLALACGSESSSYPEGAGGASSDGMGGDEAYSGGQGPAAGGSSMGGAAVGMGGAVTGSGGAVTGSGGSPGGGAPAAGGVGVTGGAVTGSGGAVTGAGGAVTGSGGVVTGSGGVVTGSGGVVTGSGGVVTGSGGVVTGSGGVVTGSGGVVTGSGGVVTGGTGGDAAGGTSGSGGQAQPEEPTLITSAQNAYWQEGQLTEVTGGADITVNENTTYQDWHGFGGTFNEKGWYYLSMLSQTDRDRAIRLLFDVTDGCGFTFGRIPIGSSDYGMDRYTLAETANDYSMNSFSIARDQQYLIPYIKAALAVKPNIRFWASPWTPPPWMKDNNAYDRGNMKSDAQTLDAHALYLARFVEEYADQGINVEAIHPQNEPGYPQDYPSCSWSASVFADHIANHLGPLFAQRLPNTQIWCGTMSNPNSSSIVSQVMGGSAAQYVDGIGLQWGMEGNAASYCNQYSVPVYQTEHKCGNYPWEGGYQQTAPNDHAYAVESWGYIKTWISNGVNAYLAWNMVLDTVGRSLDEVRPWAQNALLTVNASSNQLIITPAYYVFRHCAQYVEPGAVRVGVNGGDALAFRNPDGSIVTIMYNSGGSRQTTLAVGAATLQFSIPGNGWATVYWPSA
jgi:glucosylceramidase